jgi:hypothetical protein
MKNPPLHNFRYGILYAALARFLAPLLIELDARLDKRLVRTRLANRGGHPDVPRSHQWVAPE